MITIHFAGRDPAALVRDLRSLASVHGGTVRAASAGMVVSDDLARRWLATGQGPNGAAPAPAVEPEVQVSGGVSIQTWRPPVPEAGTPEAPTSPGRGWTPARRAAYEARRQQAQQAAGAPAEHTEATDG